MVKSATGAGGGSGTETADGDGPVGVLDLGSNTVLLLVMGPQGQVLHEAAQITRLGAGVFERRRLDPDARRRTEDAARAMASRARRLGATRVVGVGTEALRRADDGEAFLAALARLASLDAARVLSPEEEADLTLEASRRAHPGERLAVIDVGGGSTEVAWIEATGASRGVSLALGSVRQTEACVRSDPPDREDLARLEVAIRAGLAPLEGRGVRSDRVVAVAGTATTLAALDLGLDPYDGVRIEGLELGRGVLAGWLERLARMTSAERAGLAGLGPGRADVIVAGLSILEGVLEALGADGFHTSERGVRHGVGLRLLAGGRPV